MYKALHKNNFVIGISLKGCKNSNLKIAIRERSVYVIL